MVKLIGTGYNKGRTFAPGNGVQVIDGVVEIPDQHEGLIRWLGLVQNMFPEGSPELKAALERDKLHEAQNAGQGTGLQSGVRGAASTDGDAVKRSAAPAPAVQQPANDGPAAGAAERVPGGDGHVNPRVGQALTKLDPTNDEHWTKDGKPAIAAVAALANLATVSRADIERAAPGLTRLNARKEG